MNRIAVLTLVTALAAVGSGCINGRISGPVEVYLPPDDPISGGDGYATASDLDAAAQQLLARMRAHEAFKAEYTNVCAKTEGLPVLVVDEVYCPTRLPFSTKCRLQLLREKLMASAFESGLFRVYDPSESGCAKADLVLQSTLRCIHESSGCNVYRLQLLVRNRQTQFVIWMGSETLVKRR